MSRRRAAAAAASAAALPRAASAARRLRAMTVIDRPSWGCACAFEERAYNTRPYVENIRIPSLLRAMRPQQWVKNLFVLAPVVFAHRLDDPALVGRALLALAAFCAGASAIYLANDVRDREADRHHPLKQKRPIAAAEVS